MANYLAGFTAVQRLAAILFLLAVLVQGLYAAPHEPSDVQWVAEEVTPPKSFTGGIEGPVCDWLGNLYAVCYQKDKTIGKVTPDGKASLFAVVPNGGAVNGLRIDSQGFLIAADYVNHIVHRVDPRTGEFLESLTKDWKGPQFHQPNDVGIASDDTIYFTDPDWKSPTGGRIFMITPGPARRTVQLDDGLNSPNGITVSPDDQRVYVGQSNAHNVLVYDRRADGTLHNRRVFIDFPSQGVSDKGLPDGIRCDTQGNLYVSMVYTGRVYIVHADGKLHPKSIDALGKSPANVTFGGPDRRTLYITEKEHGRIVKARVAYPGLR
ncbi:MAG: SMP-30/gluconolactonase/LRE family protein [Acidimicrobiia bacterium]|nr:SMP-30/gluconolactonase/LRE family protein [Acidimicrobiia bacterium]